MSTVQTATEIRTFEVEIPDEQIDDLRRRIRATRWPEKELVVDASQGVQTKMLQELGATGARSTTSADWRRG